MDSRKIVLTQTALVAAGELIGVAAMIGIFALLNRLDSGVLWGGAAGGVLAVLNFFVMAIGASLAADKAEAQDVAGGKRLLKTSMLVRYAVLFLVLFACAKSGLFNKIALVVPLVFVRPTLTLAEFFRKKEAR
jgi:hypothetical protein